MIKLSTLPLTPEIVVKIAAIDEFKGLWRGIDDHTTGLNLLADVAVHGDKLRKLLEPLRTYPLDEDLMWMLHKVVSREIRDGIYKSASVPLPFQGKDGVVLDDIETAMPEDAAVYMPKLMKWLRDTMPDDQANHPVLVMAVFTAIYMLISPFPDANWRVVRLLIVLMMLMADYRYVPFIALEPIMNDPQMQVRMHRTLAVLQETLETDRPDWDGWLHCFCDCLVAQKDVLYARIYHGQSAVDLTDMAGMPVLSVKILSYIQTKKRCTMQDLIKATRGRRSTIKLRLSELVEAGLIRRHGAGRGVWYSLA